MKTERLYFNGQLVQLPKGTTISSNYQIATFENLENRQISFTNTLSIPKTEAFIDILNGYGIEAANSTRPYRINKVTYIRNEVLQFENASAIIKSLSDSFKINIFFQNNSLFEAIEGRNISDLDFTNLNHRLNISNYNELLADGVLSYPLANYGAQADQEIIFEYQIPAIKTSFLWNKIFADNGFSYIYKGRGNKDDFNPFKSEEWNDARITLDNGIESDKTEDDEEIQPENEPSIIGKQQFEIDFFEYRNGLPYEFVKGFRFDIQRFDSNIFTGPQNDTTFFFPQTENYYMFDFGGSIVASNIQEAKIEIVKNGILLAEVGEISNGVSQFNYNQRFYLTSDDLVLFRIKFINEETSPNLSLNYDVSLTVTVDNRFKNVNLNEYFKSISQKDFIKNLANKFGLIFVQKGNVYEFISCKELLTPYANYNNFNAIKPINFVFEDWSSKFHRLVEQKTILSNQWNRRNDLVYNYENENETFADSQIQIEDQTLQSEGVIIKSLFTAPRNSALFIGSNRLKRIALYEVEEEGIKPKKQKPYFITTKKINGSFKYKQIGGLVKNYNGPYQIASFDKISFTALKNNWLQSFENILNRTEKIKVELSIDEIDVKKLDWFKLKYIKQLGGLYYLSKINNFTNNETTECELIKVRPQEQIGEFNDDFNDDFNN